MVNIPAPHPTLADVASIAGVSIKTASRVLNDSINVAPETAEKVRQAAAQIGYRSLDPSGLLIEPAAEPLADLSAALLDSMPAIISGILKRRAAFDTRNTFSFCSVMIDAFAVIPGSNFRSGFSAVSKTV